MTQLVMPLPALPLVVEWKTITMVGPVIEEGLSKAMHVGADDRQEYIAKGVGFGFKQSRFGPANELISALIGRELGIPMNEFALLNFEGAVLFGSRWIPQSARSYCISDQQLRTCRNLDDIYKIVPFDVFVCNTDRHQCNLIIRQQRGARQPPTSLLIANDHDRCLLPGDLVPEDLASYWEEIEPGKFLKSPVLRNSLRNPDRLDEEVMAIETLPDETIAAALRTVPDAWLSRPHRRLVRKFLLERRDQVRGIVRELATECPNLQQGAIR